MRLLRKREAGVAMIMALIMLALGGLLVTPALKLALTSLKYHGTIERRTMESYAADSGVQYALCRLRNEPSSDNFTDNFTLNGRTVSVTAEDMGSNIHKITATATSSGGRSTTIESYFRTLSIFSEHVVISNGDVDINGSYIHAFDGEGDPVEGEADMHSNGEFVMDWSELDGHITYVGGYDITHSSYLDDPQVGEVKELPEIDTEFWAEKAKATGDIRYGKVEAVDSLGPTYIYGDLDIQDSAVTLTGTVYVTGDVVIKGESIVTGAETLLAEGDVDIKSTDYDPDNLPLIMSVYGNIECKQDSWVGALLYAPTGMIDLKSDCKLYGSAVGNEVIIKNSEVIYIIEIPDPEDLPGAEVIVITYGYGP